MSHAGDIQLAKDKIINIISYIISCANGQSEGPLRPSCSCQKGDDNCIFFLSVSAQCRADAGMDKVRHIGYFLQYILLVLADD